jgi:5-methylcytosine-specific restriction endonuclease McrA
MSFDPLKADRKFERAVLGGSIYGQKNKPVRKAISKDLREKVWLKYMGNRVQGKCYCCRIKPIHYTDFYVGHDKAVAVGGSNHITNLRPICRSCNLGMKTKSIEWYRKKYYAEPSIKPKRKVKRKVKPKQQQGLFPKVKFQEYKF